MAGDRPGVRGAAKDDRGDPTEYGFLLIGRSEGLLQLYFIPVFCIRQYSLAIPSVLAPSPGIEILMIIWFAR